MDLEQILSNLDVGRRVLAYLDRPASSRLRETNRLMRNIVDDIFCLAQEIPVKFSILYKVLLPLQDQQDKFNSSRGRRFKIYNIRLIVESQPNGFDWWHLNWFINFRPLINVTSIAFLITPSRENWIKCLGFAHKLCNLEVPITLLNYPMPLQKLHTLTLYRDAIQSIQITQEFEDHLITVLQKARVLSQLSVMDFILSPLCAKFLPMTIKSIHLFNAANLWPVLSSLPILELSVSRVPLSQIYDLFRLLNDKSATLTTLKVGKLPSNIYHHWPTKMQTLESLSLEQYDGPLCAFNRASFPSLYSLSLIIDGCLKIKDTTATSSVRHLTLDFKTASTLPTHTLLRISSLFHFVNEVSLFRVPNMCTIENVVNAFPNLISLKLSVGKINEDMDERLFTHLHSLQRLKYLSVDVETKDHDEPRLNFPFILKNMKRSNCIEKLFLKEVRNINCNDLCEMMPVLKILILTNCTMTNVVPNSSNPMLYVKSSMSPFHGPYCFQCNSYN